MLVHITIAEGANRDEVLLAVKAKTHVSGLNEKRFQRHGVITAEVDAASIEALRAINGVTSVSVDEQKFIR